MARGIRWGKSAGGMTLLTVLIVVAVLYFARDVLIPLALAILLAFILAPTVNRLRHWGVGRIPSAVSVVLLAFAVTGIIVAVMASQLNDLAHKLPGYQQNMHQKLESLRASGGGAIERVSRIIRNVSEELTPTPAPAPNADREQRPVAVELRGSSLAPLQVIRTILGSVASIMLTGAIVVVFAMFMLIQQEDLRDRMIRLGGARRVGLTTKVLADTAEGVSRYLGAQLVVNLAYGLLTGVGLYFLKVPNPLLWGIIAALLRYVPYLGIWIAASMPAAVAFAVQEGWLSLPIIFGFYFAIDLVMYNFVEPLVYGKSTGVSPIAILATAVFWTWLWGPVGLLLATPLTVCLVVIGRHVPKFEFLCVMLSSGPVLGPATRFYQRMLAMDLEDATDIAKTFLKGKSLQELYDEVFVPALRLAEEDRHLGRTDSQRQEFMLRNTRALVERLAGRASPSRTVGDSSGDSGRTPNSTTADAVCIPANDEADEIATLMLVQLLETQGASARLLPAGALANAGLENAGRNRPKIACVSGVAASGHRHARRLCQRLRAQFPETKVVAGVLNGSDSGGSRGSQPPIPAHALATTLKEEVAQILALVAMTKDKAQEPVLT